MELIEDYDVIIAGTIYDFNLDLLTKNLTLKISVQIYDPSKKYTEKERRGRIGLEYYELKIIGIKNLDFDSPSIGPFVGSSIADMAIYKVRDNEYKAGIDLALTSLDIICSSLELIKISEEEMDYNKAYRF